MNEKIKIELKIETNFTLEECGCCGCWHRSNWHGDCRNDDERFTDPDLQLTAKIESRLGKLGIKGDIDVIEQAFQAQLNRHLVSITYDKIEEKEIGIGVLRRAFFEGYLESCEEQLATEKSKSPEKEKTS